MGATNKIMNSYPKIKSVKPLENKRLLVVFENSIQQIYDCSSLIQEEIFNILKDDFFFKLVKVDHGGYGIIWNDEVDLSESELWINGKPA